MSILLTRLLRQAEAKLAEGDEAGAETLCCQVLTGAAALCDTQLVAESVALLRRIPMIDAEERGQAILALHNKAVSMQPQQIDDEAALSLCESLLTLTPSMPTVHTGVHNMAVFIASRLGPERRQPYIQRLLLLLDAVKMPEIDPADGVEVQAADGPERAADILAGRGVVLIRGLLDPARFTTLYDAGVRHFNERGLQAARADEVGDVVPLLTGDVEDFLTPMLRRFFPILPTLQIRQTYMRRVSSTHPETAVPFHQDVQVFGRLLVNLWTPLTPCGRDAPGLELVPQRLRDVAVTETSDNQYSELQISEALVYERFGRDVLYRPEMEPGDVLAFLGTTIHRTHVRPEMTEQRFSVELRFGLE